MQTFEQFLEMKLNEQPLAPPPVAAGPPGGGISAPGALPPGGPPMGGIPPAGLGGGLGSAPPIGGMPPIGPPGTPQQASVKPKETPSVWNVIEKLLSGIEKVKKPNEAQPRNSSLLGL